jgi:type VI secretion system secreted protein Hcp
MRISNLKRHIVTCVLVGALLPAVPALAAIDAYMVIKAEKQGPIKGEAMSEKIAITSVSHDTVMASAGMASGKRQHGAITIRKEVDAASPKLFQAMNSHEGLSDVTIVFRGGAAKAVETLDLKDAMITAVRTSGRTETITIEYGTIQVTYVNGNKTAIDDWNAPS